MILYDVVAETSGNRARSYGVVEDLPTARRIAERTATMIRTSLSAALDGVEITGRAQPGLGLVVSTPSAGPLATVRIERRKSLA